jgi:hypothetical protein
MSDAEAISLRFEVPLPCLDPQQARPARTK